MEALIFAPLSWLYRLGTWIDRSLRTKHRLSRPVISVGNLALGGRSKTPVVIHLCRRLKSAGFAPVVLTRGHARAVKDSIQWNLGDASDSLFLGDEATEIARSGAADAVLVGKHRAENAQKFLYSQSKVKPWVFVLDDGFQHWSLIRDVDIVLVNQKDKGNRVFPWGELREHPSALQRADYVLTIGKDILKETQLSASAQSLVQPLVLTTRANVKDYLREMKKRFPDMRQKILKDHASAQAIENAIRLFEGSDVILGDKESVKLLSDVEYRTWLEVGCIKKRFGATEKRLHRAALHISWVAEHSVLQQIFSKLRNFDGVFVS